MHILTYPKDSKALREVAAPVTKEMIASDEFRAKLAEMLEIAKKDGIGLAATQVGWNIQLFILLVDRNLEKLVEPIVVINPKITVESATKAKAKEGCLSFPDLELSVERPQSIKWQAESLTGEKMESEETYVPQSAPGYFIRVIQHETDHLSGRLMIDGISSTQRVKVASWLKKQS